MKCAVESCAGKAHCKGLCKLHYQRQWRTGSVDVSRPCLHGSLEERFARHFIPGAPNACWEWKGNRDKEGYGSIRSGHTQDRAHRVAFRLNGGQLKPGQQVLHSCNNPPCVNPAHLRAGNHLQNMADRMASGHYLEGEKHFNSKLSDAEADQVRCATGTNKEIAARFGISPSQVRNIRRGLQRRKKEAA